MARRRNSEDNSSLELLLDTMTNAFGGVLFLAILICVQLKDRAEVSAEQPDLQSEITRLEAEKAVLEVQLQSQLRQKQTAEQFLEHYGNQSDLVALEHLRQIQERVEELAMKDSGLAEEIARIQEQESQSARELEALARANDSTQQELLRMRAELESEIDKRTISGKLPRRRRSSKNEVALAIKFDRLYQIVTAGAYNETDLQIRKSNRGTELEPKSNGGTELAGPTMRGKVLAAIDGSPNTHYVAIAVWPDSFDQFQAVKQYIIAAGFEYRLIMMNDDEPLTTGGGAAYTQ